MDVVRRYPHDGPPVVNERVDSVLSSHQFVPPCSGGRPHPPYVSPVHSGDCVDIVIMAVVVHGQRSHPCCPRAPVTGRERKHAVNYFCQVVLPRFTGVQSLVEGQLGWMQGVFAPDGDRVLLRVPIGSSCFASSVKEAFDKHSLRPARFTVHVFEHLPEGVRSVQAIDMVGFLVTMSAASTAAATGMMWR